MEIKLHQSKRYEFNLNMVVPNKVIDTTHIPLTTLYDMYHPNGGVFYDVFHRQETQLLVKRLWIFQLLSQNMMMTINIMMNTMVTMNVLKK